MSENKNKINKPEYDLNQGIEFKRQDVLILIDRLCEQVKHQEEIDKYMTYKLLYAIQGEILPLLNIEGHVYEGGTSSVN